MMGSGVVLRDRSSGATGCPQPVRRKCGWAHGLRTTRGTPIVPSGLDDPTHHPGTHHEPSGKASRIASQFRVTTVPSILIRPGEIAWTSNGRPLEKPPVPGAPVSTNFAEIEPPSFDHRP